ncbi:GTPase Era [Thermincola potens]|uniref:GTPase Era n=1 Tax=Thermincola potens (strain JR) TaxID=635013 RepID=D5XAQ3_THEPJ|nr:GTPase Era [Thermincola potens]ADG83257.1 GTP-binding protein Era [Thermincola potens JR]
MAEGFKSGFVALIGRPNVGKSTLMNKFLGQKLAIMSEKPQTTRNKINGVLTGENYQVIFLDTPGIHKPKHKLGEYMVQVAYNALKEVDLILFLVEATEQEVGTGDRYILEQLQEIKTPVILVINKIDLVQKDAILPVIDAYTARKQFAEVVPVSAITGANLQALLDNILKYLPEGPKYYPDDIISDQPERFVMAELIREKVLELTRDEVPHSVAVDIEEVTARKNETVYVRAVVYVERESQKGIIVGKGGQMLKKVGAFARQDIENLLGSKVYLDLWVKVKKDWRNRANILQGFGYKLDT